MVNFERKIYIPSDDKTKIHLSVIPHDQKPEDYNPLRDMGEVFSVFDILSIGKGKSQTGLDEAFEKLEKEYI